MGIHSLEVYGDSQLVIGQVTGASRVREPRLVPYHEAAIDLAERDIQFIFVSRVYNTQADELAGIAATLSFPSDSKLQKFSRERCDMPSCLQTAQVNIVSQASTSAATPSTSAMKVSTATQSSTHAAPFVAARLSISTTPSMSAVPSTLAGPIDKQIHKSAVVSMQKTAIPNDRQPTGEAGSTR